MYSNMVQNMPYPLSDVLFGKENVAAYYLEFDDDRSGDFEPLAKVSGDKKVVLNTQMRLKQMRNSQNGMAPLMAS